MQIGETEEFKIEKETGYLLVVCRACTRALRGVSLAASRTTNLPVCVRASSLEEIRGLSPLARRAPPLPTKRMPLPLRRRGGVATPFAIRVASSATSSAAQHIPVALLHVQGTRARRRIRILERDARKNGERMETARSRHQG